MIKINENYLNLEGSYLFSEIAKRVNVYSDNNSDKKIIKLGIGDVTKPLTPSITQGLKDAVDEMSKEESFKGYRSDEGYEFLREIRKDPELKKIKVYILSNLGQDEEINQGFTEGADGYMIKTNLTPGQLLENVNKIFLGKSVGIKRRT